MKRFRLFLIICMIFQSINFSVAVFAEGTPEAVVCNASAFSIVSSTDTTACGGRDRVERGENIALKTDGSLNVMSAPYLKYDISEYLQKNYNIKRVYFLAKTIDNGYAYKTSVKLFDCPLNELTDETNYTNAPQKTDSAFANFSFTGVENLLQENYPVYANASSLNVAVDITDYVNEKINSGNDSFTFMIQPGYSGSTYNLKGMIPVLYIELDGINETPSVNITSPSVDDKIYEGNTFYVKAEAYDDRGIESVVFYIDDITYNAESEGGGIYSCEISDLFAGVHSLSVVVTDIFGRTATKQTEFNIEVFVKEHEFILPKIYVNTENGNSSQSDSATDGKWIISSVGEDLENPGRALYCRYNTDAIEAQGYDIESAWLMMNAEEANGVIGLYDLSETLESGSNFSTVPEHQKEAFATASLSSLSALNPNDYINSEGLAEQIKPEDYNLVTNITGYISDKRSNGIMDFGFMIYTPDKSASYSLTSLPVLCLKFSGKNIKPQITVLSPDKEQYLTSENINFSVEAKDLDGLIDRVDMFIDDNKLDAAVNDNIYSVVIPKQNVGNHVLRAVAYDNGGKFCEVKKEISVNYQIVNLVETTVASVEYAQLKYGDESVTGPDSNANYWLQGAGSDSVPYARATAIKFDISTYAGYQIEKAELISCGSVNQASINGLLYELLSNEWSTGINYLQLPKYSDKTIATTSASYLKPLKENGYNVPDGYTMAFDITNQVTDKIDKGEFNLSYVMMLSGTGSICIGNRVTKPLLYITYKDNRKPVISISSPEALCAVPNEELKVAAVITDNDTGLEQCTFSFDGVNYPLSANGDEYSTVISPSSVTEGVHRVSFIAVDRLGAKTVLEKDIDAVNYRINSRSFSDGNGGAAVLEVGKTVMTEVDITCTKYQPITLMLALYDENNTMRGFGFAKTDVESGETKKVSAELVIPNGVDLARSSIRAYITDSFVDMNILAAVAELGK